MTLEDTTWWMRLATPVQSASRPTENPAVASPTDTRAVVTYGEPGGDPARAISGRLPQPVVRRHGNGVPGPR